MLPDQDPWKMRSYTIFSKPPTVLPMTDKSILLTVFHQEISLGKLLTMQKVHSRMQSNTVPRNLVVKPTW